MDHHACIALAVHSQQVVKPAGMGLADAVAEIPCSLAVGTGCTIHIDPTSLLLLSTSY